MHTKFRMDRFHLVRNQQENRTYTDGEKSNEDNRGERCDRRCCLRVGAQKLLQWFDEAGNVV